MKSRGKIIIVAALAAVVVAVVIVYFARRTPFEQRRPAVGEAAPDINLGDLSGRMVSLAEQREKVVLVNFWASWCPPCKTELGWFEEVYGEYEERGFLVVAISLDNVTPEMVREMGLSFPVMVVNERVREAYGNVMDVPVSFLVGRDGIINKKVKKVYSEKALRADLEAALGAPASK
jgi:peroxiredoxin